MRGRARACLVAVRTCVVIESPCVSVCWVSSDGSCVDGASVVLDLGNGAAFLLAVHGHSSTSGSDDWQASSHIGALDDLLFRSVTAARGLIGVCGNCTTRHVTRTSKCERGRVNATRSRYSESKQCGRFCHRHVVTPWPWIVNTTYSEAVAP